MTFTPLPESGIVELVQQLLRSDAKIANVVEDRIRPVALEQGDAMPAITYEQTSREPQHHLGGPAAYSFTRMEITAYGDSSAQARRVARQVEHCLSGYRGSLDDEHRVDYCQLEFEYDVTEEPDSGSSKFRYLIVQNYQVMHAEFMPSGLGV